jgi:hypothetical protein
VAAPVEVDLAAGQDAVDVEEESLDFDFDFDFD